MWPAEAAQCRFICELQSGLRRNKHDPSLHFALFELIFERLSLKKCCVQVLHFVATRWYSCRSCVVFTSVLGY